MNWRLRLNLHYVVLALGLFCLTASAAHAQDPERKQAFVYGLTNYNGSVYTSALVPTSVDTVYLLADRENVVAPRLTLIYFWPITNEYLADWEKMNQLVDGVLEVYHDGRLANTISLSYYVIQYESNDAAGTVNLSTGADAQAKYATWQMLQDTYHTELATYYQALEDWDKQINALRQASPDGTIAPDKAPPQPQQPSSSTLVSTNLAQGYIFSLPAGSYDIQVKRSDGSIQPDSRKRLVMFAKQQTGIAYSVVPQSRWNVPEQSDEPDSVVYAVPGATLYFQAFQAGQYNDYEYSHMLDPQEQASQPGRGKWVSFGPTTQPQMRLQSGGQTVGTVGSEAFYVRQLPSSGLGYEVAPFDAATMAKPTFEGYTINLSAPGADYEVELLDVNGAPLPGSQRHVIALYTDRALWPYALSPLPLLAGLGMLIARRRQARRIKVEESTVA
jgi:hypothetical protein